MFDGVEKHRVVNLTFEYKKIAIVRWLEAYSFQYSNTTIDLCYTSLNSCVGQVDLSEFLIGGFLLEVFNESTDCLEARLCDAR